MDHKKIIIKKKTITAPTVVNDIEFISKETGKGFCTLAYDFLLLGISEWKKKREIEINMNGNRSVINALKNEVSRVLDKYPVK